LQINLYSPDNLGSSVILCKNLFSHIEAGLRSLDMKIFLILL